MFSLKFCFEKMWQFYCTKMPILKTVPTILIILILLFCLIIVYCILCCDQKSEDIANTAIPAQDSEYFPLALDLKPLWSIWTPDLLQSVGHPPVLVNRQFKPFRAVSVMILIQEKIVSPQSLHQHLIQNRIRRPTKKSCGMRRCTTTLQLIDNSFPKY